MSKTSTVQIRTPFRQLKRQVLSLCIAYDLGLNRFSTMSREERYRAMPKGPLENAHARVGLAVNQLDLRRAADLHGAHSNGIRVIEATEAVRVARAPQRSRTLVPGAHRSVDSPANTSSSLLR